MAIITEDYVSFETAKLLKEKGFDEGCYMVYVPTHKEYMMRNDAGHSNSMHPDDYYAAPTLQMAMKWLREKYNIDIEVHPDVGMLGIKVYTPMVSTYKSTTDNPGGLRQYKRGLFYANDSGVISALQHFNSYEEACEAAIKYCLENLI